MFVGDNTKIFPSNEVNEQGRIFIQSLHRGEFYATLLEPAADNCTATSCEGIGIFWMVANNRTLPRMDFFWCRATHNSQHEDSNRAFVEVLYPECDGTMSLATTNKPVNVTTVTKGIPNSDTVTTATTNNGSSIRFTFIIFALSSFLCMLA